MAGLHELSILYTAAISQSPLTAPSTRRQAAAAADVRGAAERRPAARVPEGAAGAPQGGGGHQPGRGVSHYTRHRLRSVAQRGGDAGLWAMCGGRGVTVFFTCRLGFALFGFLFD